MNEKKQHDRKCCETCKGDGWRQNLMDECPDCLGTGKVEDPVNIAEILMCRARRNMSATSSAFAQARSLYKRRRDAYLTLKDADLKTQIPIPPNYAHLP